MEKVELPVEKKGQHLSEFYPLIESNVILNKKFSGIGATHCEIIAPRNSIIVVPNTPIITCKVDKHSKTDNLFGVKQYVEVKDIVNYLEKSKENNRYFKIMTTPESFYKVRQAFDEAAINIYETCFLLLDECHKFIKERDFRQDIVLPFRFFFNFKNKALVSATPIPPSDPRFEQQNFKWVEVKPGFDDYLFDISIIPTNDIRLAFKDDYTGIFKSFMPEECQCIFVNSVDVIADLIKESNLNDISGVFCSEISVHKLKSLGIKNVYCDWRPEYEKKFMFFTSRFYTGLDIWLDKPPRVLYLTDAENLEQTLMDPSTDMAQACGRFRNGMKEIIHYVVFNPSIKFKKEEEIDDYIKGVEKSFNALTKIYDESNSEIERRAILTSIQSIPFNEIFIDGEIDFFLKDNIIEAERLKSYYRDFYELQTAYGKSNYLKIPWEEDPRLYFKEKHSKLQSTFSRKYKNERRQAILQSLECLAPYSGTTEINDIINYMKSLDKLIVDAYFKLGPELIKQCNYNSNKLKEQLSNVKSHNRYDETFYSVLLSTFEVGKKYLCSDAKEKLQKIYDKFNLTPPSKITAQSLKWHFEIDNKARIGNPKAIKIIRPTAEGLVKYYNEIKNNKETHPSEEE